MSIRKKTLLVAGITPTVMVVIVIAIVALNFRDYGIKNAKQKSLITAEFVRDSLTAHMVNGIMDKRGYFLEKIENSKNVKSLWLVRSANIDEQFGESSLSKGARDEIDKEVLKTGKTIYLLNEDAESAELRVTVPYVATSYGNPNCLQCHVAKEGDVLGAISMVFDISDIREGGTLTIVRILAISAIFLGIAIVATNYLINPYLDFFESLKNAIRRAENGDFGYRVVTKLKDEAGDIAKWLNNLYDKLQNTVENIEKQVSILISTSENIYSKNPLIKASEVINQLVDIYKFKRTIELDKTKGEIYKRIFFILEEKLGIKNFLFFETDESSKKRELVYIVHENECIWKEIDGIELNSCRAYRTNSEVYSDDFYNVCEQCIIEDSVTDYICLPYPISQSRGVVISIRPRDKEDMTRIKMLLPLIKNYLDSAKPVIESKILTEMLKDSSLRDGMTGLYNRRFLERYLEKATFQASRAKTGYAILMIDIDYFKMVNDTYGHDNGDLVIKGLVEILRDNIRESDLAIRFGGEEFLVMLYNPTEEGALKVAEKLRVAFSQRVFLMGGKSLKKTISIGVSFFPKDTEAIWQAIKFADIALYEAKRGGRNRVVRFEKSMKEDTENY